MSRCSSCGSPIRWVMLRKRGETERKPHPLDPEPVPDGTIAIIGAVDGKPAAEVVATTGSQVPLFAETGTSRLYRSHFSTCPQAAEHRRPKI